MRGRMPSPPPQLRGYSYQRLLGSGGFADVFLYEQQMPRRQVAVKVLLSDVFSEAVREEFHSEANLMARVSTHPYIVSVYQADIADDGRPFIVMEYCPRDNLAVKYRQDRVGVAEVLRIGIRLAAAVETAHRTGILHRDIKPANVLITQYGWPALTDFGIAATTAQNSVADAMSVPWSPPEVFAEPPTHDVRSDVWSLGATLYTLLARRSPFEQPGGRNGAADLITRIERDTLPPLGREDVPPSLEAVLSRSMAKRPASRFRSAVEFARALQQVEIELQLAPTTIDVFDPTSVSDGGDDDGEDARTRIRGLVRLPPQPPLRSVRVVPAYVAAVAPEESATRPGAAGATPASETLDEGAETRLHADRQRAAEPVAAVPPPERRRAGLAVASVVVLAAVVAGGVLLGRGPDERGGGGTIGEDSPQDAVPDVVPRVKALTGTSNANAASFTWTNPDPRPGDRFLWNRVDPSFETSPVAVDGPPVVVQAAGRVCIKVLLLRSNGKASTVAEPACAPGA